MFFYWFQGGSMCFNIFRERNEESKRRDNNLLFLKVSDWNGKVGVVVAVVTFIESVRT